MKLPFILRRTHERELEFFKRELQSADLNHAEALKKLDVKTAVLDAVEKAMPRLREREYAKGFSAGVAYTKRVYVEQLRKTIYNAKQ